MSPQARRKLVTIERCQEKTISQKRIEKRSIWLTVLITTPAEKW